MSYAYSSIREAAAAAETLTLKAFEPGAVDALLEESRQLVGLKGDRAALSTQIEPQLIGLTDSIFRHAPGLGSPFPSLKPLTRQRIAATKS